MALTDFFHILNPQRHHRSDVKKYFDHVSRGCYAWVERSSHPTHLETLVEWAVREGRRKIVVWGGDGTLSRAVQSLVDLGALDDVSLALVPVGTCNDFSRAFTADKWPTRAKNILNKPSSLLMVDIGLLEAGKVKKIFINNAGFGRTKEAAETGRRHPLLDIFRFTKKRLAVEWEISNHAKKKDLSVFFGVIFNAPYFGGGKHFSKDISPSDGSLIGFFIPVQNRLSLLCKFIRSAKNKILRDPLATRIDGEWLHITSNMDLFPQADGEMVADDPVREIKFSILKKKLKLIVPT